jgi:hypothetical protein
MKETYQIKEGKIVEVGVIFFPLLMEHVTQYGHKKCYIYYMYIKCTQSS